MNAKPAPEKTPAKSKAKPAAKTAAPKKAAKPAVKKAAAEKPVVKPAPVPADVVDVVEVKAEAKAPKAAKTAEKAAKAPKAPKAPKAAGKPIKIYTFTKSHTLFKRAAKVIPCGIYGHYSPAPLIPVDMYPFFSEKANGSHFWDVDGNEFIDYMCAYGPMVMGYHNPVVDKAYLEQLKVGDTVTCAPRLMVELAEFLVDLMPAMDWAYFAKNGGDVTNYATMVARAATGREKIVAIKGGYHGVAPWMQTLGHAGVIDDDQKNVIRIPWNDVAAFERVLAENPKNVAGFISSPYHHPVFVDNEMPADGYWQKIEALCRKEGVALIIDDVRAGFRLDMRGSHEYFGFKPDLVCICKAMANGYPISSLLGVDAMHNAAAKVFYTGSYWFSAAPMAAARACLTEMKRIDAPAMMLAKGQKMCDGLVKIAQDHGFNLKISGATSMPYLRLTDDDSLMLHQQVSGESTRRGVFFSSHHNWFLSTAHTDEDIQRTWDVFDDALKAVKAK